MNLYTAVLRNKESKSIHLLQLYENSPDKVKMVLESSQYKDLFELVDILEISATSVIHYDYTLPESNSDDIKGIVKLL